MSSRAYVARDVFMPPGHLTRIASSNYILRARRMPKPVGEGDKEEEGNKRTLVDPHVVRDVCVLLFS